MGIIKKFFVFAIVVGIGALIYPLFTKNGEKEPPKLEEKWFGKTKLKAGEAIPLDSLTINKFSVNVSEEVLQDLKRRLESARFVEPIGGTEFNYGFNSDYLRKVVDYWKTTFDWRKQELVLNKFNHYKTQINGINIHYIHVKPIKSAKRVVPLLITHGWPGSVWEYYKTIPLLIEPTNGIALELILPSIPGYGFSDAPQQEGLDVTQTARIWVKLMDRLGHKKFFAHGGDWGSAVTRALALYFPENVRGMHTTLTTIQPKGLAAIKFFVGMFFPSLIFENPEKDYNKIFPLMDKLSFLVRETGYMHLQATKPDTVGAALIDSPVGVAAYILEKFSTWTDPNNVKKSDGGLTQKFTLDELLTNIMIYWTSNNVASSLRYYKESVPNIFLKGMLDYKVCGSVPAAVADFPNELSRSPRELNEYLYGNLVQYTEMPRGGHFAAMEEPKLVSDDIKKFIKTVLNIEKQHLLD